MKNVSWLANQLSPCRSSAQLTRPYSVSNIHCQTIVAVSAGIAQAMISDADTNRRMPRAERLEQQGDEDAEHHRQGDVDEAEDQRPPQDGPEVGVLEDRAEVVQADPRRRLPEHLRQPVLLQRHGAQPDERVAEHRRRARRRPAAGGRRAAPMPAAGPPRPEPPGPPVAAARGGRGGGDGHRAAVSLVAGQPLSVLSIAASAWPRPRRCRRPGRSRTSMSWRTLAASTPAQFSLRRHEAAVLRPPRPGRRRRRCR